MRKQIYQLVELCKAWIDFNNKYGVGHNTYAKDKLDILVQHHDDFCSVNINSISIAVLIQNNGKIKISFDYNITDSDLEKLYTDYSDLLQWYYENKAEELEQKRAERVEKKRAELKAELAALEGQA